MVLFVCYRVYRVVNCVAEAVSGYFVVVKLAATGDRVVNP